MGRWLKKYKTLIIIGVFGVFWVYPILLVILNSFKSYNDMIGNFLSLPSGISFDKYGEAWTSLGIPHLFRNTLFYTLATVALIALIAPMAAYKLSRTKTKLSGLIFGLIILPMMVPFQTYMLTLTRFLSIVKLNGTVVGYILTNVGLCMPLAVFMIHGFVKNIPLSLDECAYIDGAGRYRTYFSIILPLLVPILTTVVVIDALATWNDVLVNILVLGSNSATMNIQQALYMRFSAQTSDWERALPGIVISILPNIIFFVFMQKYIVEGITAGAVKE